MDKILLEGLVFFGTHGVNPEEKVLGQRFNVNLEIMLDLSMPAMTDNLPDTVSYSAIYKLVRSEVEGDPSKLLEHLAGGSWSRCSNLTREYARCTSKSPNRTRLSKRARQGRWRLR